MELKLDTFVTGKESSGGLLSVDGKFQCFTCEDQPQKVKVAGETRIPAGRYQVLLRTEGGMTKRYGNKFPFHAGMLWLQAVPEFKWIYIHMGNTDDHTDGCILVGQALTVRESESKIPSRQTEPAYVKLYKKILSAINNAEEVWIEVVR